MNLSFSTPASAALLVLATAAFAPDARAADDGVAFKFRTAPINSMGITSLDELRGKPVIIDFWGTR